MLRSLTLRQIEAFQAVMISGSLTGAAQMLNLTQPAISRLIQSMEGVLSLNLFERSGNRIAATREAGLLYEEVKRCFIGLDQIEKAAGDIGRNQIGMLRIAGMTGPSLGFLPSVLGEFTRNFDNVSTSLTVTSSYNVRELVAMRHCDLGLAYAFGDFPGLDLEPLEGLDAVCIMPAEHRLAQMKSITAKELDGVPLVGLGSGSELWRRFTARMIEAGAEINQKAEASVSLAVCRLVSEGVGIAVVEPFTAAYFIDSSLAVRLLQPSMSFDLSLIYPTGIVRSEFVHMISALIRKQATMVNLMPDIAVG